MHIKFKIAKFLEALDIVKLTVDKTGHLDTKDVLLSAGFKNSKGILYLYSTNFINQAITYIDADVTEEGSLPFNPDQLYAALSKRESSIDAEATLIHNDKQSVIKISKSKFKLDTTKSLSLLKRLESIKLNEPHLIEIDPDDLTEIFKRVKVCVSTDMNNTNKQMLRGVHIASKDKSYHVESTDGLSASSVVLEQANILPEIDIVIPGEFIPILLNICRIAKKLKANVQVIKNNYIYFKLPNIMIGTSIMVGKYPNIDGIFSVSKPDNIINIATDQFKPALNRIITFENFNSKSTGLISLTGSDLDKTIRIKTPSVLDCEEVIDLPEQLNIPENSIKINGAKLLEVVNTISLANITLGIPQQQNKPLYLEEVIPNKLTSKFILMPSR